MSKRKEPKLRRVNKKKVVIEKLLKTCKKIIFIKNKENKGHPKAINQGIKLALKENSNYLLISNNDIEYYPQSINEGMIGARNSKNIFITAVDKTRNYNKSCKALYLNGINWWEGLCMSCFIITKDIINKVGYFDENLFPGNYEDMDWMHRCSLLNIAGRSYIPFVVEHEHGYTQDKYNFNSIEILNKNREYVNQKHNIKLGW